MLASHLAVAIENATLYRETRRYASLLATLYEIGKETSSILDLDELLQRVAEVVKRVIDYEMFGILLLDEARGELVLRKAVSYGASKEKKTRIPLGEGLTGAAAVSKQPLLVGDVRNDPRYLALIPDTRSELVVPLVHKDRLIGVFDLESSVLDRFNLEHLKVLTPLASQVAAAIENARLYETLARQEERLGRELELAQWIQQNLFPDEPPAGAGWDASAHFLPASELGGDLYDFFELGEGVLGVAVGDVLGKGVPAALFGAFVSGSIRGRAMERRAPGDMMTRVNRTLRKRGAEGFYCTVAFARLRFPAAPDGAGQLRAALPAACTARRSAAWRRSIFPACPWAPSIPRPTKSAWCRCRRATWSCSTPTASPRPMARTTTTARSAWPPSSPPPPTAPRPRSASASSESVDAFLGEAPRSDDLTLVVVKVR